MKNKFRDRDRGALAKMRHLKRILSKEKNFLYPPENEIEVTDLAETPSSSKNDAIAIPEGIVVKKEPIDAAYCQIISEEPSYTLMSYIFHPKKWLNNQRRYIVGKFEPPLVKIEDDSSGDDFQPQKKKKRTMKRKRPQILTSPRKQK